MSVQELIDELLLTENKDLQVMIGMGSNFQYLELEDLGVTTFGIPCDEFGLPLEGKVEEGPTVFTLSIMDEDDFIMDDEED